MRSKLMLAAAALLLFLNCGCDEHGYWGPTPSAELASQLKSTILQGIQDIKAKLTAFRLNPGARITPSSRLKR